MTNTPGLLRVREQSELDKALKSVMLEDDAGEFVIAASEFVIAAGEFVIAASEFVIAAGEFVIAASEFVIAASEGYGHRIAALWNMAERLRLTTEEIDGRKIDNAMYKLEELELMIERGDLK